jgi:DNA end-binding protein Ku
MTARAMWKGLLELADFSVPFKLFAAVSDPSVRFRMVERQSLRPVRQQMVHPATEQPVLPEQIRKGLLKGDTIVFVRPEELEALTPEPSRSVQVSRLVPADAITPECFLRPYYLGPDGKDDAYFALADALTESGHQALCMWVMRNTAYSGVLRAEAGYLTLFTLRVDEDVLKPSQLPVPSGAAHTDKELKMAEQLVLAFADGFDPNAYHDSTEERVRAFLADKAEGRAPRAAAKPPMKARERDLSGVLEQSLRALKEQKSVA